MPQPNPGGSRPQATQDNTTQSVVPSTRTLSPSHQRRPNTPSNTMVSYRPMLSQKAKRHVVTITDALVRTTSSTDDAIMLQREGGGDMSEGESAIVSTSTPTRQQARRYPVRAAQTPPPSLHRTHVPDASWTGGVLRSESAHLEEALDEDYLSEVPTAIASPMPLHDRPYVASSIFELRKATPVVTGFDRLDNAIMRLVHRLPESTLEDKFQLISRWLDSYHVDVVPRKLASQLGLLLGIGEELTAGGMDDGVGGMTRVGSSIGGGRPANNTSSGMLAIGGGLFGAASDSAENSTTLKSIISAAFSLHQLMLVLVKHKPILGPVAMRTLQAIYNALYISRNPLSSMPPELMDFTASREALHQTLRHFQHRTYFQETRDSQRRMAAVQEFTARYETVKRRQMSSVKRQIDGRATMWMGVCFAVWKGEVRRGKGDRQQQAALISLRTDHERAQERIRHLDDTVAKRDATIVELRETIKTLQHRGELAAAAFKYDMLHNSNEVTKLNHSLAELKARCLESEASCNALFAAHTSNRDALQHQLKQLDASLWLTRSFLRASDMWRSVDGPVTPENACKFVRMLACRSIEKHRDAWEDPPPPPSPQMSIMRGAGSFTIQPLPEGGDGSVGGTLLDAAGATSGSAGFDHEVAAAITSMSAAKNLSLSDAPSQAVATEPILATSTSAVMAAVATPTPPPAPQHSALHTLCERYLKERTTITIPHGHDLLNILALAMLDLYDDASEQQHSGRTQLTVAWTDVASQFLQCSVLQQKVQTFIKWCRSDTRFPFGSVLHEFFLEEENPLVCQAVALEFLQLAISPLRRLSSFRDSQTTGDALAAPSRIPYRKSAPIPPQLVNENMGTSDEAPTAEQPPLQLQELTPAALARVEALGKSVEVLNPLEALHDRLKSFADGTQVASACDALLAAHIGPRLSWGLLTAASRQLTVAETADRAAFQVTAKDIQSVPTIIAEDDATLKSIQSIVAVHVLFLRHAFMFYAGFESGNAVSATLSDFGLVKMMRDARIGLPGAVDVGVVKALAGDGLSPKRFVTALTHIAVLRFSQSSPPDALSGLIWRLRATLNTQSLDSLVLSPLRDQWVFNRMMDDVRPEIMKVFRRYATESAAGSRITTAEVSKMLQELKLSDDQLTTAEVQESFTLLGAVQGGLVFDQFVQLLFVLGTLRLRAPWLQRTARVTRFVYDLILTPLQKKAQLTVVSL